MRLRTSGTGRAGTSLCESLQSANTYGTKSPRLPLTDQAQQEGNRMTSKTTDLIAEIAATRASTLEHELNNAVDKAGRMP